MANLEKLKNPNAFKQKVLDDSFITLDESLEVLKAKHQEACHLDKLRAQGYITFNVEESQSLWAKIDCLADLIESNGVLMGERGTHWRKINHLTT